MNSGRLINLRKELHRHPELSGEESATSNKIILELTKYEPDQFIEGLGGNGILACFMPQNGAPDKRILLRAELDAIAVDEESNLDYRSESKGVMHGCGHDGHMAILIGVAETLSRNRPENTAVYLLFQPAEETGKGAEAVMKDRRFNQLCFDYGFALHNLPGFKEGEVILADGLFSLASAGFEITFKGKSSHAAYPEEGLNPVRYVMHFIEGLLDRFELIQKNDHHAKAVVTYIKLGKKAFGVNPGIANVGFTIRASEDDSIQEMAVWVKNKIESEMDSFEGEISFNLVEPFAATINSLNGTRIVEKSAVDAGIKIKKISEPFPWSEDFGGFREKFPVTLFGLGAGIHHPPLHSECYDFNDRLIEKGVQIYLSIIAMVDQGSLLRENSVHQECMKSKND